MPRPYCSKPEATFDADVRAALRWGARAGLVLAGEHVALWPWQDRWGGFWRWVPYCLGTVTLGAAFAGWAQERGQGRALLGLACITAIGGAATILTYRLHARWGGTLLREEAPLGYAVPAAPDYGLYTQ